MGKFNDVSVPFRGSCFEINKVKVLSTMRFHKFPSPFGVRVLKFAAVALQS